MTEPTLYDNDAAFKLSAYACWETVAATPFYPPAILRVATFSLASQSKKAARVADVDGFRSRLAAFLTACSVIEPTEEEIRQATELEEKAASLAEEFDTGESQLIAVLINRNLRQLVTGDKRALKALGALDVEDAKGRIFCLEQLLRLVIAQGDWEKVRGQVCAEKDIDRAIAIVFACYSQPEKATILEGLNSYIRNARGASGQMLGE